MKAQVSSETGPQPARDPVEHVRGRISQVEAPRTVDLVDQPPRTATGTLQERRLRDAYLG